MSGGTPKNLKQAIVNGLAEANTVIMGLDEAKGLASETIPHVVDFLAQRFGVAMLSPHTDSHEERRLMELYQSITGKALK